MLSMNSENHCNLVYAMSDKKTQYVHYILIQFQSKIIKLNCFIGSRPTVINYLTLFYQIFSNTIYDKYF